jgi:hypothetical protein
VSEGEGACSPRSKVRSHLPLRGKLGWMTPRVGVKTTLTNGNAPIGALVPKQEPHFLSSRQLFLPAAFSLACPWKRVGPHFTPLSNFLIHLAGYRNIQLMQHMGDFGIA